MMKYEHTERDMKLVHWKELLSEKTNPNVIPFIKYNGDIFFSEFVSIIKNIHKKGIEITKKNKKETISFNIEMPIHVNCNYLITFTDSDFVDILDYCLIFFEAKEMYEACSEIVELKKVIGSYEANSTDVKKIVTASISIEDDDIDLDNPFNKFFN
jgi:hypothetical protein